MDGPVMVLGATGFLGPAIIGQLDRVPVIAGGRDLIDLHGEPVRIGPVLDELRPTAVINAASVGPGRGDDADMRRVNHDGAQAVAEACVERSIRLVHVSTDVVFDGAHAPYTDDAEPDQTVGYGGSKAAGELAVRSAHPAAAVVRPSLIWDLHRIDNGTRSFVDRLARGERLTLWPDVYRQPVAAGDLARLLVELAVRQPDVRGPINAGGREVIDRARFGRLLLEHFAIDVDDEQLVEVDAPDTVAKDLRMHTSWVDDSPIRLRGVSELLIRGNW